MRKEKPERTASIVDMAHVGNGAPVEEEEDEVGSDHPSRPSCRLRVLAVSCYIFVSVVGHAHGAQLRNQFVRF